MRKDILTTGNVARVCNVSLGTVANWFDKGLLKGFRIPSGSRHRRILLKNLIEFLENNKMPYDEVALREFQLMGSCSD